MNAPKGDPIRSLKSGVYDASFRVRVESDWILVECLLCNAIIYSESRAQASPSVAMAVERTMMSHGHYHT